MKDNSDLEKGVMIGILHIAEDSISPSLNNLSVFSLLDLEFQDHFGFTEAEVECLIEDFAVKEAETLKNWYNGYLFGERIIYNPWSVLSFISRKRKVPRPYWINTASQFLLRDLLTRTEPGFQTQLETLLAKGTITSPLHENIILRDLDCSEKNIWSLLVFSGYLKPVRVIPQHHLLLYELAIPNLEVRSFYKKTLKEWLQQRVGSRRLQKLLAALTQADFKTFGEFLREMVLAILSYHDTGGDEPEKVYHAFVLGLLTHLMDRYLIRSNRESGYGRYDVIMIPLKLEKPGFIFEFKKVNRPTDKNEEDAMKSALKQIQEKQYAVELRDQGVKDI